MNTNKNIKNTIKDTENYLGYFGYGLTWWQRLYLRFNPFLLYSSLFQRRVLKTGLNFMLFLEELKKTAKTEEEKLFYEQIQKEYVEFNKNLTLSYWR